jgi:transcriptional regulator with XRE-family HTH domain/tetratricopeptide (TPR) repeat protein
LSASFGEMLRRHRLAADLTQAGLAEAAGLSEQAVSMLERGTRRRPRADTIHALSVALKLSPAEEEALLAAVRERGAPQTPRTEQRPSTPVPWELPPTVADFTAREEELDAVLGALARSEQASIRVVITGMGGVGKTAIAVHAGHLSADRFPDGQLYVNLRGYDPGSALTSAEALGQLLRSLGVRSDALPGGLDEMASLYRSRIAGRRMLILLDDANSVDQVTPLLPGDVGSATVITSRRFLATLPGSLIVRLATFTEQDSIRLLSSVAGAPRVASEDGAARALWSLTGGLPLALRLVGARLAARPNWLLQHFVDQLEDEHRRLDELGLDHSGVRATFEASLNELLTGTPTDRQAAAIFDLLSLTGGREISVPLTARLANQDLPATEELLESLVDLHLLDSLGPLRYRIHDLLRTYAGERLTVESRQDERRAAIERGLQYYAATAWQAHRITHPWSPRRPTEELDSTGVPRFTELAEAPSWIDAEYESIIDLYRKAAAVPGLARRFGPLLALGLFGYLEIRAYWPRMRTVYDMALASGPATDDPATFGWLEHDRAIPDIEQGHLEAGHRRLLRALMLFESIDSTVGTAQCCASLSHVCERLDRIDEAIEWGERALVLAQKADETGPLGTSHLALGVLYNRDGRSAQAEASFNASFELAAGAGNFRSLARRHRVAASSYIALGEYATGIEHLNTALGLFSTTIEDPIGLAEALQILSSAQLALGDYATAEKTARDGLQLTEKFRDTYRQGRLLAALANAQEALGNHRAAHDSRERAINIFESEGVPAEAAEIRTHQSPGS